MFLGECSYVGVVWLGVYIIFWTGRFCRGYNFGFVFGNVFYFEKRLFGWGVVMGRADPEGYAEFVCWGFCDV